MGASGLRIATYGPTTIGGGLPLSRGQMSLHGVVDAEVSVPLCPHEDLGLARCADDGRLGPGAAIRLAGLDDVLADVGLRRDDGAGVVPLLDRPAIAVLEGTVLRMHATRNRAV